MNYIYKFFKTALVLLLLLIIPAASYAIADVSVYGGYSFAGEMKGDVGNADVYGWQVGFYGHMNAGIPMIFTLGIGVFYQITPLTLTYDSTEADATMSAAGVDSYFQVDLPFLPVLPYARAGLAIREDLEIKYTGNTISKDEYFKSYYYGFGLSYTLLDVVVWDLQLFAEYLRTTSKQEDDIELRGHAVNLGLKLSL
jgi:hypothetical protein